VVLVVLENNKMETSIIIRTKNEEKWIGKVLEKLCEQTYKDFEIIIVDSGSTDKTLEIAKKFNVNILNIKPEEFTYPFALNFGCKKANATKFFVFLSAHSIPISTTWLEDGLSNFNNNKVMGVYGEIQALPDGTWIEKIFWNGLKIKIDCLLNYKKIFKQAAMGVMGFTNAIIRKDLWEQHNIDEHYAMGGEDQVWSDYWFKNGYVAIQDAKFSVYHSHGLGLIGLLRQMLQWKSLAKTQNFKQLKYRK